MDIKLLRDRVGNFRTRELFQPSFYISSGRGGNGSLDDASEDEAESYVSIDGGSTDDDATDSEESE